MSAARRPTKRARGANAASSPAKMYWVNTAPLSRKTRHEHFDELLARIDRVSAGVLEAFPYDLSDYTAEQIDATYNLETLGVYARRWRRHMRKVTNTGDTDTDSDARCDDSPLHELGGPDRSRYFSDDSSDETVDTYIRHKTTTAKDAKRTSVCQKKVAKRASVALKTAGKESVDEWEEDWEDEKDDSDDEDWKDK